MANNNYENARDFVKYLQANGFNSAKCQYVLELGKAAPDSLSQFLKEYKQYLLSTEVRYDELEELHIKGANGKLGRYGISVPKTPYNDLYFKKHMNTNIFGVSNYNVPSINQFDTIICEGISEDLVNTAAFNIRKYVGFCVNKDTNIKGRMAYLEMLLEAYNNQKNDEYIMVHDTDKDKEYYLIRKKHKIL